MSGAINEGINARKRKRRLTERGVRNDWAPPYGKSLKRANGKRRR